MTVTLLMVASPAWAETFIVNSTGDEGDHSLGGTCATAPVPEGFEGECTLRAAIQEANFTTASDTINFDIPGSGVQTIEVGKPPAGSTTGNGVLPPITQPVTINGYTQRPCSEGNPAPCSRPNTNAVGTNAVLLIQLDGRGGANGSGYGLEIRASDSMIKGLVISRFTFSGIFINDSNSRIEGNFIGTDPPGTLDLGNSDNGVVIDGQTSSSSDNTIGGTLPEARNIISGNGSSGVAIFGGEGNKVLGNLIGTTKSGTGNLGNDIYGVLAANGNNTTIGGNGAARNTIAFNKADGVQIFGESSMGNRILFNSIHSNGGVGIDLAGGTQNADGVTANDPGDTDTGPNTLQNFPGIASATTSGSQTTIRGRLNSRPNKSFTVQFFSSPQADPSGFGEGRTFLGQKKVATDANGDASFTFVPARKVAVGQTMTATATGPGGNTSEFSRAREVTPS